MITGANSGIGKATAVGLAKMGATLVMVCRDGNRGEKALAEIKQKSDNDDIHLMLADFASLAQVRQLNSDFRERFSQLHVLINNAGIITQKRTLTEDGFETQFQVNHLAHFLLTNLLLDVLKGSAPSRIINVSSEAHHGVRLNFDNLQTERNYRPSRVYSKTKLANVLFTYELARRLEDTGVTVNCLHPGVIATKLLANYMGMPKPLRFSSNLMGGTPEKGAQTPIYLATSPDVEELTGKYVVNLKQTPSSDESYDETSAKRLWEISEQLTGL